MKKLAAEQRAKVSAEQNHCRGLSNALRSFGIDIDIFCQDVGPPRARSKDDLLEKKLLLLLGDEDSAQYLVIYFQKKHVSKQ